MHALLFAPIASHLRGFSDEENFSINAANSVPWLQPGMRIEAQVGANGATWSPAVVVGADRETVTVNISGSTDVATIPVMLFRRSGWWWWRWCWVTYYCQRSGMVDVYAFALKLALPSQCYVFLFFPFLYFPSFHFLCVFV